MMHPKTVQNRSLKDQQIEQKNFMHERNAKKTALELHCSKYSKKNWKKHLANSHIRALAH